MGCKNCELCQKYHSLYRNYGDSHDISEDNTMWKNRQTDSVTCTATAIRHSCNKQHYNTLHIFSSNL